MKTMQPGLHLKINHGLSVLVFLMTASLVSPAALAVVQELNLVGSENEIISIPAGGFAFETESGDVLPVRTAEDDDGNVIVYVDFTGHRDSNGLSEPGHLIIGEERIAVPSARAGERIVVSLRDLNAFVSPFRFDPAGPVPRGWFGFVDGGVGSVDVTPVGAGTQILPDGEFSVAIGDDSIDTTDFGFAVGYDRFVFEYRNSSGDETSSGSIPPGMIDVGIVHGEELPLDSGATTTGIFLGPAGMDAITSVDYDEDAARFDVRFDSVYLPSDAVLSPYLRFSYESFDLDYDSTITTPTFSDISQSAEQSLEHTFAAVGVGTRLTWPLGERWRWGVEAGLDVGRYDTELDSTHVGACGACPDPAQQSYMQQIEQDENDITYRALFGMFWGFSIMSGGTGGGLSAADLELYGIVVHMEDFPGIFNPVSGDDLFVDNRPTQIVYDSQTQYTAGLRLNFRF